MSPEPVPEAVIDPALCPLCGRPNDCLLAAGATSNEECWCFRMRFPPVLLARVPEQARRRACICQRCVREAVEPCGEPGAHLTWPSHRHTL